MMKNAYLIYFLLSISFLIFNTLDVQAQEVKTLAIIPAHSQASGGIAIDVEGNVYTAHFSGTTVVKVYPDGSFETFATGFKTPSGNAFDSQGNFYQSNYADPLNPNALDTVDKIDTAGVKTTFATGLNGPVGITVDSDDNLFVCGCNANVVYKITQDSEVSVFASSPLFNCPNGIIFDDFGNLYMVNWGDGRLFKITGDGTVSLLGTIPGGGNGHVGYYENTLYIAARTGSQVYKSDLLGNIELFAGTGVEGVQNGPLLEATFTRPNACTVSPDGQFIYTNGRASRVRQIEINAPISSVNSSLKANRLSISKIYPNPTAGVIQLILEAEKPMETTLVLSDLNGRTLQTKTVQLITGQNELTWDVQSHNGQAISSGVYLLKVEIAGDFFTQKIGIGTGF